MNRLVLVLCAILPSVSPLAIAQDPGTGLYAFGTFDSRGFDTINVGNLNIHFQVPIVNKPGRGLNFAYSLVYDGLVWSPVTTTGTTVWVPDINWGFRGQLVGPITGYLTFMSQSLPCGRGIGVRNSNYVYHDPYGKNHLFNYRPGFCGGPANPDGSSTDGSGYSLTPDLVVHSYTGQTLNVPINPPAGSITSGNITDSNGNAITNNGNGTFTDTLGVTALTIGGFGKASSPLTLSYPVTLQSDSATTASATAYYKTYTVQTNFQCSGITEYGATNIDLMDHITLADAVGSTYSFTYEATPGVSGAVTGRLASITLPTGGTINYSYSGGCSSSGTGINADGTVGSLTRATSDGTRQYTRSSVNANATNTILQDEKGNQILYQFTINGGFFFETHRQAYQGSIGATPLMDLATCYSNTPYVVNLTNCDGMAISLPINSTTSYISYNGGTALQAFAEFGVTSPVLTGTSFFVNGSTLGYSNISYYTLGGVSGVASYDGSSNLIAQTTYGYDETTPLTTSGIPQHSGVTGIRGNRTSSHVTTASGSTINTTTLYYDTGAPVSTTTPNGTTALTYDPTQTFVTQTTLPTPSSGVQLATSATFDQQSGAQISATGMNAGQISQVTQYDRLLRPLSISLPNGGQVNNTVYSVLDVGTSQTMGNGQSTNMRTLVDGYGRKSRVAIYNGQSSNQWYQIDYCYDATGLLQFQTVPYQGNGWGTSKQCSGNGTSYTYDTLGRVLSTTNADGTATTQYNGRAVMKTDVNGVQKIIQSDSLGKVSGICEISSNPSMPGSSGSPQPCGMDIPGTGFLTNYTYDLANHTTTVTQGTQTRVFKTDAAGRSIYASEPERGVTTYSYAYNGTGLYVTRQRSQANQTNPSVLTTTVSQYDSVGRPVSVTYNDGITSQKNFAYDMATGWNGMSLGQSVGQLTYAWTSSPWIGTQFVYDSMGNVVRSVQCLPNRCGNPTFDVNQLYTYDLSGNLVGDTYFQGANTTGEVDTAYSLTPAAEAVSITNTLAGTTNNSGVVLTNIQNGPFGPISYQFGNGRTGTSVYDNQGRLTGKTVVVPPDQWCYYGGCDTYYMRSTIRGSQVTWISDESLQRTLNFGYDEFGRLTSASSSGDLAYSWSYDRWGNRWSQNISPDFQYDGNPVNLSFNTSNNQVVGDSYDAAGNLTGNGNYTYDAEGNVLSNTYDSSSSIYDAFNHRAQFVQRGVNTQFAFNLNGQRTSSWQGTSSTPTLVEAATYLNGQMVSFFDGTGTTFTHYDAFGTKRAETGYQWVGGYVDGWTRTFTSLPFGDGYGQGYGGGGTTGDDSNHFALLDGGNNVSILHAQFRDYAPGIGRWMSPDPYDGSYRMGNPQSFNRYSYAGNNPLGRVDPLGLDYCEGYSTTSSYDPSTGTYTNPDVPYDQSSCSAAGGQWILTGPTTTSISTTENVYLYATDYEAGWNLIGASIGPNPDADNAQTLPFSQGIAAGAGASNNGPHYTQADVCGASALLNKGLATALDALGIIPGEGNVLGAVQLGAGLISGGMAVFGNGFSDSSPTDAAFAGGGLGLTLVDKAGPKFRAKFFGENLKVVPLLGNALSVAATYNDLYGKEGVVSYYNDCLEGKN
jgi:RHS repeat-associated protein